MPKTQRRDTTQTLVLFLRNYLFNDKLTITLCDGRKSLMEKFERNSKTCPGREIFGHAKQKKIIQKFDFLYGEVVEKISWHLPFPLLAARSRRSSFVQ